MKRLIFILSLIALFAACTKKSPLEPEVVNHYYYYTNNTENSTTYYITNVYTNTLVYISNYYFTNDLPFDYTVMTGYIETSDYVSLYGTSCLIFSNDKFTIKSMFEFYYEYILPPTKYIKCDREAIGDNDDDIWYTEENRIVLVDDKVGTAREYNNRHYILHVLTPEF